MLRNLLIHSSHILSIMWLKMDLKERLAKLYWASKGHPIIDLWKAWK